MILAHIALATNYWQNRPILEEFENGQKIALARRRDDLSKSLNLEGNTAELKGIESLYQDDIKTIGVWNESVRKVPVEFALYVSPELISRWLGYLKVREAWQDGEEIGRWQDLRSKLSGKYSYLVILSSYPTKTLLGLGEDEPQPQDEIKNVRFVLQSEVGVTEPDVMLLNFRACKTKGEIEAVDWWKETPVMPTLKFMFEKEESEPYYVFNRGNYARSFWWVESDEDLGTGDVTLKIVNRRKIRQATFSTKSDI